MYIFYDFETSSRDLIGQIISYAFIITDSDLQPIDTFDGKIKLNRTQCPEVDALLVNKIVVSDLQEKGISEYEAALAIFDFLTQTIASYGPCHLVGFNSNQFDLSFLRTLLIRYGLNPYFQGQLKNIDILHFVQYLAFYHSADFPWVQTSSDTHSFYSFRLEDLSHAACLLTEAQSHDALEDVMLTIKLVRFFEAKFNTKLSTFKPYQLPDSLNCIEPTSIIKQRVRHFATLEDTPEKYQTHYFFPLNLNSKSLLFINLSMYKTLIDDIESPSDEDKSRCIRYINTNKAFFITEQAELSDVGMNPQDLELILADTYFQQFVKNPSAYFDSIKKDWDIDYQIHELGFERIDILGKLVERFMKQPQTYTEIIQDLIKQRSHPKDNYLIQLFNRVYLNYHPHPQQTHLNRYLTPRYIEGSLYKDSGYEHFFEKQYAYLLDRLDTCDNETDLIVLQSLVDFFEEFSTLVLSTQAQV